MIGHRSAFLAPLIVMVGGCLSGREPPRIYALEVAPDSATQSEAAVGRNQFHLQRVLVPDYIDTNEILRRVGVHEIQASSTGRFGERLSLGVTRALWSDLATRLPLDASESAPSRGNPVRQILVTVETFDAWSSGRCMLVADWTILDADRGAVVIIGHGTFTTASAGPTISNDAAIVAAMADAVRQLADRIASTAQVIAP